MGVYLSIHYKSHQFTHTDNNVFYIDVFFTQNTISFDSNKTFIQNLKSYYDQLIENEETPTFVIFLADSKLFYIFENPKSKKLHGTFGLG